MCLVNFWKLQEFLGGITKAIPQHFLTFIHFDFEKTVQFTQTILGAQGTEKYQYKLDNPCLGFRRKKWILIEGLLGDFYWTEGKHERNNSSPLFLWFLLNGREEEQEKLVTVSCVCSFSWEREWGKRLTALRTFLLLLFSCWVMCKGLQPHGLQHARLLCPPLSPRVCSSSSPLSRWCHLTILCILCRPLLLLLTDYPHIKGFFFFSNELALHISWPECWSFSFSNSPSNKY